jgi:hypothetical protein
MDTDGHGYQAVAQNRRLTQEVSEKRSPKSVVIRIAIHESFLCLRKLFRRQSSSIAGSSFVGVDGREYCVWRRAPGNASAEQH